MKLIAQVKLLATPQQHDALLQTMRTANDACNVISKRAWETQTFRQFDLHKLTYHPIRQAFKLASQLVIGCLGKVADAYKTPRQRARIFRRNASIIYDSRVLTWAMDKHEVSIWALNKRLAIPFVCGEKQWNLLQSQRGETDLVYRNGVFYLHTTCEIAEKTVKTVTQALGVDLGIVNIATDSDGVRHSGKHVRSVRYRNRRLRRLLQNKQTDSARRRLKKLSGQEYRFAADVNHRISKQLVEKAERTGRGIALEKLTGIRDRVRVKKPQRDELHSWSFADLGEKIEYKAKRAGVPIFWVDPRNTSRTCLKCGHCDKRNRVSQASFRCVQCGFAAHADDVAACNIASRAAVNPPNVGRGAD